MISSVLAMGEHGFSPAVPGERSWSWSSQTSSDLLHSLCFLSKLPLQPSNLYLGSCCPYQ